MEVMPNSLHLQFLLVPSVFSLLSTLLYPASGSGYDYGTQPRFVCTPIPVDADPACSSAPVSGMGAAGHSGPPTPPAGRWGMSEESKATILHLRESLVQQKEIILDQRETIRELTAKLTLCEGLNRGAVPSDRHHGTASHSHHTGMTSHHSYTDDSHHSNHQGHHENKLIPDSPHYLSAMGQHFDGDHGDNNQGKEKHVTPAEATSTPEQMERLLQALKDRLDNLQKRNTSITYSTSLRELLQRKISSLEHQLHQRTTAISGPAHHDDDSGHRDDEEHHDADNGHLDDHKDGSHSDTQTDHHDDSHKDEHHDTDGSHDDHNDSHHDSDDDDDRHHSNEADNYSYLPHTGYRVPGHHAEFQSNKLDSILNQLSLAGSSRKKSRSNDAFQISFPIRSNYMYGRVKRTLMHEIFALTLCLWIKTGMEPGLGTPFSYSAPGQANELVLIEWGDNPMELLINDKAATLPLSVSDGKWHHVCVTWTTRDGHWEAYQDGIQKGSGINLSPWHPIKPGGVFILGQEQDTLGGRFDAMQSFVGEMADVQMWSHVLTASDVYSLASCGNHLRGDVIAWSTMEVELRGGVSKYPFDPCH